MASIFTFDPDPPRVSSPWATATQPLDQQPHRIPPHDSKRGQPIDITSERKKDIDIPEASTLEYSTIIRLEAEPQEGPTEYKLHLLLRRRRSFTNVSTRRHVPGSLRRSDLSAPLSANRSVSESSLLSSTPPPLSATTSRQHRLEQLTTQMLWRLQQSCPHHSSSSMAGVQLQFPDEASLATPIMPQRLYAGLEESKGALYEIGVADDGELVGLAEDEMEESLNNLRAMAASLGCQVDVVRMVPVGHCEWIESGQKLEPQVRKSKLLVAEAYVHPDHHLMKQGHPGHKDKGLQHPTERASLPQLRVSLTGATMSGKSTLLGTLSTGTLDNGRGKSRLSLLKHRHEIESGVTSSITQELIGYGDLLSSEGARTGTQVINYGSTDISSWVDIHTSSGSSTAGRLVFLTDSAGHPRFRRTTVRGLIGWDPHYTLLCIPADNLEDTPAYQGISQPSNPPSTGLDLSGEHLHLCLSLELPLLIVITKYDLAKKAGLKSVLTRVLSALRDAGRTGRIIADPSISVSEEGLEEISSADLFEAEGVSNAFGTSPLATVPIIFTSALRGTGLRKLHAILRTLPMPAASTPPSTVSGPLFHVEDTYAAHSGRANSDKPIIVGGHLRSGELSIGDELFLGPYPVDAGSDDSDSGSGRPSMRNSPVPTSRSYPGALQKRSTISLHTHAGAGAQMEWRSVRVTSLRNLRLPVSTLHSGQVGTLGLVPVHAPLSSPAITRIRKGMVISDKLSEAYRTISVHFTGTQAGNAKALTIGSAVVVFVASVRAPSKVLSVAPISTTNETAAGRDDHVSTGLGEDGFGFGFGFDDDPTNDPPDENGGTPANAVRTVVQFQFIGSREFVEQNAKILVMPGGGPGLTGSTERGEKGVAGLEGFVGKVVDGHV